MQEPLGQYIYTLRNQLVHGGATWHAAVNRDQLRDCVKLMSQLVPLIITVMMNNRMPYGAMRVIRWWG